MTPTKITIADGIELCHISTAKFKTGALTFSVCTPLTERDYLLGLVLAGVMRRGTRSLPSMALINRRLDELYASCVDIQSVIHGDVLCFNISADVLNSRYALDGTDVIGGVIQTVADILLRPLTEDGAFPPKTVESEKSFVKDSLAAEINNTRLYAATRLKELMCRSGNTRFPTLDYLLSQIDTVTARELTEYHARLISLPLNVSYIGDESIESVSEKIRAAFPATLPTSSNSYAVPDAEPACKFVSVSEDMPVNQGKLCLGMRTGAVIGSTQSSVAVMLNEIFGASPASKLFLNVRERLGLCYYCSSSYSMLSGNLTVASGIDVSNKDRATEEILAQLEQMAKGNITDAEIRAAKKSLEYSYVQIYDSPFSLQSFYSIRSLFGISETVEDCKARLLSVTKEDVSELAGKVIYDTCFFINGTLSGNTGVDEDE